MIRSREDTRAIEGQSASKMPPPGNIFGKRVVNALARDALALHDLVDAVSRAINNHSHDTQVNGNALAEDLWDIIRAEIKRTK